MTTTLRIVAGPVSARATLDGSRTARAVWAALPIEAPAQTWGDEIYFPVPVDLPEDGAQEVVALGDLGYWPPGRAFCIFFGSTPASRGDECRPASPVNVFGRIDGDPAVFKAVRPARGCVSSGWRRPIRPPATSHRNPERPGDRADEHRRGKAMKIFLDTGSVSELREATAMGLLDGVTTNPSLVAKEKRAFRDLVEEICRIVDGPVSLEVVATDTDGMVQQGRELAKIAPNVVVKLPTTVDGLKALRILKGEGLRTNLTLCFSASQALLIAKGGATYVSPFLGRLDDISHVGMDLIRTIRKIYDNYGFETKILAASLRNPLHVVDAALAGADVATLPFAVFQQLIKHPLTDIGLKRFLDDWQKAGVTLA